MTSPSCVKMTGCATIAAVASVLGHSGCQDAASTRQIEAYPPLSRSVASDVERESRGIGSSTEPPSEASAAREMRPATVATPLFLGRFDTSDPTGPKASWPGSRIRARFEATTLSVTLQEFAEPWMDGAPSAWDVSIDGATPEKVAMVSDGAPHTFLLASGLAKGVHEVELFKRSETQTGITQFLGFDVHGGQLLPPPLPQSRRIEVLGDSQASGFGVELLNAPKLDCPGADHGANYQNFRKSWGFLLGARVDADVHAIVYSGKGLVRNMWPSDTDTLPKYYPRANPNPAIAASAPLFDLTSWLPDVIVMSQGSVDIVRGAPVDEVKDAYRTFVVGTLRKRSPNAHIIMAILGRGGRGILDKLGEEIVTEQAALGDDRFHVFVANPYTHGEMTACNGHGSPSWHARIAEELSVAIRAYTGWP
jgi:hypothetical protein